MNPKFDLPNQQFRLNHLLWFGCHLSFASCLLNIPDAGEDVQAWMWGWCYVLPMSLEQAVAGLDRIWAEFWGRRWSSRNGRCVIELSWITFLGLWKSISDSKCRRDGDLRWNSYPQPKPPFALGMKLLLALYVCWPCVCGLYFLEGETSQF